MSLTIRIVHGVKQQLPEHSQSFDVDLKIAFIKQRKTADDFIFKNYLKTPNCFFCYKSTNTFD